jgi:tetratricopeptide (TPR) repeat protein
MIYNYEFFVSYSNADNKDGFVRDFVNRLEQVPDFKKLFAPEPRVFYDKESILGMDDWESELQDAIETSRFLIVLLSPDYFQSEMCAKEFEWWVECEKRRYVLGEGIAPIRIVDVPNLLSGTIDIPPNLQKTFPNWVSELRSRQIHDDFDLIRLDTSKFDRTFAALYPACCDKVWRQDSAAKSLPNRSYPNYNEFFVGRRDELDSLRKNLVKERRVTLHGLGGVGKTELAISYGLAFAWDYQLGRIFINCEEQRSLIGAILGSGLVSMAGVEFQEDEKEEDRLAKLFNALSKRRDDVAKNERDPNLGTRLLLILDNVTNLELLNRNDMDRLKQTYKFVHVVATTQEKPSDFAPLSPLPVDPLIASDALELLRVFRPFEDDAERQAAVEIVRIFGGHAFRVEKIGAYLLCNSEVTYQDVLRDTRERYPELIKAIDANKFQRRYEKIRDEACLRPTLEKLEQNAKKLLKWAALFGPDSVVVPWLGELTKITGNDLREGLQDLKDYRLLIPLKADSKEQTPRLSDAKLARLHRIAREIVRNKMRRKTRLSMFAQIGEKIDELLTKDTSLWWGDDALRDRGSIADFCYDHYLELKNQGPSEYDPHLIRRLNDLRKFYLLDRVLEIRQASIELGQRWVAAEPGNPEALKALGVSFISLGDWLRLDASKQAREYYEKAVENFEKVRKHKPDDSDVLHGLSYSYESLGDLAKSANEYDQARKYYEKAVENFEKVRKHKPDDSDVLHGLSYSYKSLGDLAKSANDYEKAKEYYEKRLELWEKAPERKPDDSDVLHGLSDSYKSLGDLAKSANDYEKARECYQESLEIWKKMLERIPDGYFVLHGLSYSYKSLGDLAKSANDYEKAKEYYEKRLELWKKEYERKPDDYYADYYALDSLSDYYESLGDLEKSADNYEQAREYYQERLELWKKALKLSPDNSKVLDSLSDSYEGLGNLEKSANDYERARECYQESLEIWKKMLERIPDDHNMRYYFYIIPGYKAIYQWKMPDELYLLRKLRDTYDKLADLSKEEGDLEQGKKYEEKAAEIRAQIDALEAEDNL